MGGELGLHLELKDLPRADVDGDVRSLLFSESNSRFIVTVAEKDTDRFEAGLDGLPFASVGRVTKESRLVITGPEGERAVDADIFKLKEQWKSTLRGT
jgi:phosphoribosylformylglycinamidine synthase